MFFPLLTPLTHLIMAMAIIAPVFFIDQVPLTAGTDYLADERLAYMSLFARRIMLAHVIFFSFFFMSFDL